MLTETISAIATGAGVAAIGIVRISGPAALAIGTRMFVSYQGDRLDQVESHKMVYGTVTDGGRAVLDNALAVVMKAPRSYTGEDTVEFHCHGSPVVLRLVLEATIAGGARAARPGEFTRRAFINGKLDLVQVEAVSDLLYARSQRASASAVQQLTGELSAKIRAIRQDLIGFLAHVHASIDYPDEVDALSFREWRDRLQDLLATVADLLAQARLGIKIRDGIDTVLLGRANVGKSSLMNALLRAPRAIVTPIAGTTRDVIEESCEINGVAFRLSDTAGVGVGADPVEEEGIRRALNKVAEADLLLGVFDCSEPLRTEDYRVLELLENQKNALVVLNKTDQPPRIEEQLWVGKEVIKVSALKGTGISALEKAMVDLAQVGDATQPLLTRPRQAGALQAVAMALEQVLIGVEQNRTADCLAVELEDALSHLADLTGQTTSETIIDEIFTRFCVGK